MNVFWKRVDNYLKGRTCSPPRKNASPRATAPEKPAERKCYRHKQ